MERMFDYSCLLKTHARPTAVTHDRSTGVGFNGTAASCPSGTGYHCWYRERPLAMQFVHPSSGAWEPSGWQGELAFDCGEPPRANETATTICSVEACQYVALRAFACSLSLVLNGVGIARTGMFVGWYPP